MRRASGLSFACLLILLTSSGPARAARTQVPVDVGIGPAGYYFFGPVVNARGAVPHFGLKLNVYAVVDQQTIQANRGRIPARYRGAAGGLSEVRISPSFLIPDALIISPAVRSLGGTGIYGVTWRPGAVGFPLFADRTARMGLDAGVLVTYAFIHSTLAPTHLTYIPTTHFVRPGIDVKAELEVAASSSFLLSLGWASQLYVPQKVGSFGFGPLNQSIFHVGQAFLKLHFRFPYQVSL